jgi:hypothetical protein
MWAVGAEYHRRRDCDVCRKNRYNRQSCSRGAGASETARMAAAGWKNNGCFSDQCEAAHGRRITRQQCWPSSHCRVQASDKPFAPAAGSSRSCNSSSSHSYGGLPSRPGSSGDRWQRIVRSARSRTHRQQTAWQEQNITAWHASAEFRRHGCLRPIARAAYHRRPTCLVVRKSLKSANGSLIVRCPLSLEFVPVQSASSMSSPMTKHRGPRIK